MENFIGFEGSFGKGIFREVYSETKVNDLTWQGNKVTCRCNVILNDGAFGDDFRGREILSSSFLSEHGGSPRGSLDGRATLDSKLT